MSENELRKMARIDMPGVNWWVHQLRAVPRTKTRGYHFIKFIQGPRLFYVKADNMEYKGEIPFSPHLNCEVRDFRIFYIHTVVFNDCVFTELFQPRRVYHLFDPQNKALEWCKAIMDVS